MESLRAPRLSGESPFDLCCLVLRPRCKHSCFASFRPVTISLRANSMLKINKFNQTKVLLAIGVFSGALSAALWAWMWHYQGLSLINMRAEHSAALLFFYLVSLLALTLFIARLRGWHLVAVALALTVANAVLWLAYWLIDQYYLQFFILTHPFPIPAYRPRYVQNWRLFFLEPFMLLLRLGVFLFWLDSLACLIWRRRITA
jgi:hypothetical protein